MYNYENVKTQKAKGFLLVCPDLAMDMASHSVREYYLDKFQDCVRNESKKSMFFSSLEDLNKFAFNNPHFWAFGKKIFARPCPLVPRHGFVESCVIDNYDNLFKVFRALKLEDPKGELILTEFIDRAQASAVLTTSGLLSIGPGHDGATSGRNSFSIPVKPGRLPATVMKLAGLKETENVFLEAVFPSKHAHEIPFHITQVRGGPEVSAAVDFIPKQMIVSCVQRPHNDLLLWEKEVKNFKHGTVVYAPGHSLASHAAIHCIINNIPFITSYRPISGQTIYPINNAEFKLDYQDFILGLHLSLKKTFSLKIMLHLSVSILHDWAYLRNSPQASWLLGVAASYMCQVLLALCVGEYRHSHEKSGLESKNRDDIYKDVVAPLKFIKYIAKAPLISAAFVNKKKFPEREFGGVKWAAATKMCIRLWNSLINLQDKGINNTNVNKLIANLNKATHLVHNGGWLFNKVSSENLLNRISDFPQQSLFELADYIYLLHAEYSELKNYQDTDKLKKLKPVGIKK